MNSEPLITTGTITTVVAAILVFLQQMGVPLSDAQQDAIRNLVAVLAPIILALIARQFVVAPASAKRIAEKAAATGTVPDAVKEA